MFDDLIGLIVATAVAYASILWLVRRLAELRRRRRVSAGLQDGALRKARSRRNARRSGNGWIARTVRGVRRWVAAQRSAAWQRPLDREEQGRGIGAQPVPTERKPVARGLASVFRSTATMGAVTGAGQGPTQGLKPIAHMDTGHMDSSMGTAYAAPSSMRRRRSGPMGTSPYSAPARRSGMHRLDRLDRFPPLKRAIVYSELLGTPKALRDDDRW